VSELENLAAALTRVAGRLPVEIMREADQRISDALNELWNMTRGDDRQELPDIVRDLANRVGEHIQDGAFGLEGIQTQLTNYANGL
jgi:hypothetical protein